MSISVVRYDTPEPRNIPTYFGAPFDDADADIILRSSDLVDFRTHKIILAKSSPFFRAMLSLPQPTSEPLHDGLLVINMAESRETLRYLLTALTPGVPRAYSTSFDALAPVLAAAQKFEMDSALADIRAHTLRGDDSLITHENAFRAYNIARQHGLEEEVRVAARLTLESPMTMDQYASDLVIATGPALHELWLYRAECETRVRRCLRRVQCCEFDAGSMWHEHLNGKCKGQENGNESTDYSYLPRWWWDLFEEAKSLKSGVAPRVVLDRDTFYLAMLRHAVADQCAACVKEAQREMEDFWEILEIELKAAIAPVPFKFNL